MERARSICFVNTHNRCIKNVYLRAYTFFFFFKKLLRSLSRSKDDGKLCDLGGRRGLHCRRIYRLRNIPIGIAFLDTSTEKNEKNGLETFFSKDEENPIGQHRLRAPRPTLFGYFSRASSKSVVVFRRLGLNPAHWHTNFIGTVRIRFGPKDNFLIFLIFFVLSRFRKKNYCPFVWST